MITDSYRDVRPQYCYWYHLLVLRNDSSSSHTVCIAKNSSFTLSVPLSLTRTFLASWENPLLRSQEGLSGSTRHPKNITMDGIAAKPSINLWKEKEKNAKFSDKRLEEILKGSYSLLATTDGWIRSYEQSQHLNGWRGIPHLSKSCGGNSSFHLQ